MIGSTRFSALRPQQESLSSAIEDARARTLALISDLSDEQLLGPRLAIVNPLRWESGHVAWFQEHWVLRHALGRNPLHSNADALYDSSRVAHDTRWDLPLLSRSETVQYLLEVQDHVLAALRTSELVGDLGYFIRLSIAHEDMHDEAFLITRQALAYPPPPGLSSPRHLGSHSSGSSWSREFSSFAEGDVRAPGGTYLLGAVEADESFNHDNEKWAHPVVVHPFSIAKTVVTQGQFSEFISAGGYQKRDFWSAEGWRWRQEANAANPVYWRRGAQGWERRVFDRWIALEPDLPTIHVNWYEADAYCRYAHRRLPTEAEWEYATSSDGSTHSKAKRRYPWGDAFPSSEHANLDASELGCVPVGSLGGGDSPIGCRQMIGNVWEWTDTTFLPYPGFSPDPYRDYSQPWFGNHKVLRGGCWATRSRLIRNTWRNFYTPDRRDVFAGFRTCAP